MRQAGGATRLCQSKPTHVTDPPPSPLAQPFPDLPAVAGCEARTARAGYKEWARDDLTLLTFAPGTAVAGVTTRSLCPSPEVEWCRAHLPAGRARALVVNAGNANAFTGAAGAAAVRGIAEAVGERLGGPVEEVFVSSTGVIGTPLPLDRARAGLALAFGAEPKGWEAVARAIGTTDIFPKGAVTRAVVGARTVTLVGVAKGSGMIQPDMATMLAYVVTDLAIDPALWQAMLAEAVAGSFNRITVDSDTSTSDTVLAFATGAGGGPTLTSRDDPGADAVQAALSELCHRLALLVVRDGEGATKLIQVTVAGAESDESAEAVARSIANSPLVKTAVAGGDANWGRVVMAVGKAGEPADRDRLSIRFGGVEVARDGQVVPGYDEAPVAAHLAGEEVAIDVDLGLGDGRATVWTCDLTHGYISINADYRS